MLLQVWIAVAVGLRRPAGELVRHPAGLVAEQVDDLPRRVRTQQGNGEAPRRLNGLAGLVVLVHRHGELGREGRGHLVEGVDDAAVALAVRCRREQTKGVVHLLICLVVHIDFLSGGSAAGHPACFS